MRRMAISMEVLETVRIGSLSVTTVAINMGRRYLLMYTLYVHMPIHPTAPKT